jgi:multidrug efflux pump subunit AcrA (membrane-fusion protein)
MNHRTNANTARFLARYIVPTLLAGSAVAVLGYTARQAFERVPAAAVAPVAVVESTSAGPAAGEGIQAPGWVEPAPYAVEVRALRPGVVTEMLALEGAEVAADAVLARLEHGAETIALARQDAALRLAEADVEAKSAAMRAAERTLELALDAERAVRDAEAALREAEGAQGRISAEVAEAEANESEARDEHDRKSRLVEIGAASA